MSMGDDVPYHGISPDDALNSLGAPLGTGGFAAIAEACRNGRDDLVSRGLNEEGQKLSLIHISEPTRPERISYAVFCLKKKNR